MVRDIIEITEELCDGCGDCVIGCSEGAIQIIDGKARLVREEFCDGFGDCVGVCHTGALKVIRRSAAEFDDAATRRHLLQTQGAEAVRRYEQAQQSHQQSGCPGSAARELRRAENGTFASVSPSTRSAPAPATPSLIPSELGQWPVQLHLVQPGASFFNGREMVVMSTCGPLASAEIHQRYLRGRSVVVACPKLDNTAPYAQKLAAIFRQSDMPKAIVVVMEVPCCRGLSMIAEQALESSGRSDLIVEEHVLSLEGEVLSVRALG